MKKSVLFPVLLYLIAQHANAGYNGALSELYFERLPGVRSEALGRIQSI